MVSKLIESSNIGEQRFPYRYYVYPFISDDTVLIDTEKKQLHFYRTNIEGKYSKLPYGDVKKITKQRINGLEKRLNKVGILSESEDYVIDPYIYEFFFTDEQKTNCIRKKRIQETLIASGNDLKEVLLKMGEWGLEKNGITDKSKLDYIYHALENVENDNEGLTIKNILKKEIKKKLIRNGYMPNMISVSEDYLLSKITSKTMEKLKKLPSENLHYTCEQTIEQLIQKETETLSKIHTVTSTISVICENEGFEMVVPFDDIKPHILAFIKRHRKTDTRLIQSMFRQEFKDHFFQPTEIKERDKEIRDEVLHEIEKTHGLMVRILVQNVEHINQLIPFKNIVNEIQFQNFMQHIKELIVQHYEELNVSIQRIIGNAPKVTDNDKEIYQAMKKRVQHIQQQIQAKDVNAKIKTFVYDEICTYLWLVNGELIIIHPHYIGNYHSRNKYFSLTGGYIFPKFENPVLCDSYTTPVDKFLKMIFEQLLIPLVKGLHNKKEKKNQGTIQLSDYPYTDDDKRRIARLRYLLLSDEKIKNYNFIPYLTSFGEKAVFRIELKESNSSNSSFVILTPYDCIYIRNQRVIAHRKRHPQESLDDLIELLISVPRLSDESDSVDVLIGHIKRAFDLRYIVKSQDGKKL